jgi:hypothetical protein
MVNCNLFLIIILALTITELILNEFKLPPKMKIVQISMSQNGSFLHVVV